MPESIHGPIGICLLQDKCVVVSSTFEDQVVFAFVISSTVSAQVKMFTGCGQFLRLVEAEPGRRFKHPSDMVALRWVSFCTVQGWKMCLSLITVLHYLICLIRDGGFAVRDQLTV